MNTDRAAVLSESLAEYRQNRHKIRAVEIISDCCPTCSLDSKREFALDAVPLLPHAYCTNPGGCCCYYSPVPISLSAPADSEPVPQLLPEKEAPVVETLPPTSLPPATPGGLPAYLRTPAAAAVLVGAMAVGFGIMIIGRADNSGTTSAITRNGPLPPQLVPTQSVQGTALQPNVLSPKGQTPRSTPSPRAARTVRTVRAAPLSVNYRRDQELEAKAARDIREAEAIAQWNDDARRAREVAAQQQTYLQNLVRGQGQMQSSHVTNSVPLSRDTSSSDPDPAAEAPLP